ncbi:MAG: fructose-1,6-bisphosphatase [Spirochaetota bacterium]
MKLNKEQNSELTEKDIRYFKLLSEHYPSIDSACKEIINLKAILGLPKGTEHFLSDIHGEYEAFIHVLRNASGVIKRKIEDLYDEVLSLKEKKTLATLIYYPEQKLTLIEQEVEDMQEWYKITLQRLIKICRTVTSKYTRSQIREALKEDFSYIIEELLHEREEGSNKQRYYNEIIDTIIELDKAKDYIITFSKLIQRFSVFRLHIIGDIYDRGPGADIIMDKLMEYHSIDIQWGNHDIVWMGASAGSKACIANVLRLSFRYRNINTVEEGYGINILPLATFAMEVYANDPCEQFVPKEVYNRNFSQKEINLIKKMHKAITIIQFKLEGQIIKRRPQYEMEHRLLLDKIDYDKGTIKIDSKDYKLNDANFPTIDPKNPYKLTEEEEDVINKLRNSFKNSEKLQKHTNFLFTKGGMYLTYNSNLLYHGCISMTEDSEFFVFKINGEEYSGKKFMDRVERLAREGYYSKNPEKKQYGMDAMWYLWSGQNSPLFGKKKMATFERYFIDDKEARKEEKNPYYKFRDREDVAKRILKEFDLDPDNSHIINGHVPVEVKKGESPIKANGKLLVIDGGFAKAYQSKTGIAGYTLIYNSYGMLLAAHEPFETTDKAISEEKDILPETKILEQVTNRKRVADTDRGKEIKQKITDLNMLLKAYRKGILK